jgi:ornithine carbamoyltransferase
MTPATAQNLRNIQHLIAIRDLDDETVRALIDHALTRKKMFRDGRLTQSLTGKTLAMIFQKPSLRTRLSFEVAMTQLGGHAVNLDHQHVAVGERESVADAARVISSMCDGIMARMFDHADMENFAQHSSVPVINGLTDWSHPCQAMADGMTLIEHFGEVHGRRFAFVGDGNNVARSLAILCGKLNMTFILASPSGYELNEEFVESVMRDNPTMDFLVTHDPAEAVHDADIVYTDTWTSMGQEEEKAVRKSVFAPFQINAELMKNAKSSAIVMHCLPAYRGLEITDDVMDGPMSIVFDQAENRLHFQRALLELLMGGGKR